MHLNTTTPTIMRKRTRNSTMKINLGAHRDREISAFISLAIVVVCLLSVVFCKMEVRRMGYSVLKLTREERRLKDTERQQMIQLAKITRPERLQAIAEARLTLKKAESGQIIQMTERGIALRQ
jgi:cell division protein FtsL